jgi:hypothetical protein
MVPGCRRLPSRTVRNYVRSIWDAVSIRLDARATLPVAGSEFIVQRCMFFLLRAQASGCIRRCRRLRFASGESSSSDAARANRERVRHWMEIFARSPQRAELPPVRRLAMRRPRGTARNGSEPTACRSRRRPRAHSPPRKPQPPLQHTYTASTSGSRKKTDRSLPAVSSCGNCRIVADQCPNPFFPS